ncbi:MAG TPA: RelA/SpoT family protein [Bacteroidales bacterium]|nr:RelA/SpoT family protein [Bacteroidales bacterium]
MNFSDEERLRLLKLYRKLLRLVLDDSTRGFLPVIREVLNRATQAGVFQRAVPQINPLVRNLNTAYLVAEEMGLRRSTVISALLYDVVIAGFLSVEDAEKKFGASVGGILRGLTKATELYDRNTAIETENFRNLLLSFAQDGRVILIMIADRLNTMRVLKYYDAELQQKLAREATYLFAPLAHRMGLYAIKTELEDLSMKFTQAAIYQEIARKLDDTKTSREAYIKNFIEPVRKRILETTDLKFEIKGRTKSISSIWNKLKKQKIPFEDIYDLFAIRLIIDCAPDQEKSACWQAYSIVTDMYTPNTARLKDWISIPKSNGYESLHITVMGQDGKWVEVQIRTRRMDEIAERGLAAHWKYKGIKSESGLDEMLNRIREILESSETTSAGLMDDFKMNLYEHEIYVFTPKGELFKLPKGATVLDFAYSIHTNLGSKCVGAKVDGKNVPIRYELKSGDQVEIQTGSNQTPKQDWINYVVTSKARNKIKQTLKEAELKQAEFGKENLKRRMKNRKVEYDESILMRVIKKLKFKTVTEFFAAVGAEQVEVNQVIEMYLEFEKAEKATNEPGEARSAESYFVETTDVTQHAREDVLLIDQQLKGIDFKLARCCNPIYGDEVFGFVSAAGGIKIHRMDCPNAPSMIDRFGYRVVKAKWAGKADGSSYPTTLHVVGHDDIGIVTNITSMISKEPGVSLRSISIDATDGLFHGQLTVNVSDTRQLNALIKKIRTIKGVKQVDRTL